MKLSDIKPWAITLVVVVLGVVIGNMLVKHKEVDASGNVLPDGKTYRATLGFKRK